ncbi:Uncharacterised protein [Mycobacterium tuberculosis]|uniref:Uncharacterized protein n=1 Tax=Mycobacterium tuberculosis TaxID=1773 RepID=A0A654TTP3_MYCTX|nr:Uncharacterised protein [Mycobacterium tuberculosis]CFS46153.1 Uncharacterised protein [Mycobacterium tuberculosis]CKP67934.1 Uncharacterised protein [Mycobacterium tuberculosis]CKQ83301.1 Uncharacterised protein [Mycobacterium tuberculosis]COU58702.1 Uncharacterised protein [Mycobacterium tuberculosis]
MAVDAKFKLGVGDNDSAGESVIGGLHIRLQSTITQLVGTQRAYHLHHPVKRDVLVVVPQRGFSRRGEQRCGEPTGLDQARRQRDTAYLPGCLVIQ